MNQIIPIKQGQVEKSPTLADREERIVNIVKKSWLELARELMAIKQGELYREGGFYSWNDYLEKRLILLDLTARYVRNLISACFAYESLRNIVPPGTPLPLAEGQIRPLAGMQDEKERAFLWERAVEKAGGDTPTERQVREAIAEAKESKRKKSIEKKKLNLPSPSKSEKPKEDRPQLTLASPGIVEAPEYILLSEWKEKTAADRKDYLTTRSDIVFNKQDGPGIEWAKWSWNPVTGCNHDCPYCYARDIAERFYPQRFAPTIHPKRLPAPFNTKVPAQSINDISYKNVFVCSMADLFGRWVPGEWIQAVLDRVHGNPQWNFLFLTKFPKRMAEFEFPENAWIGTTVDCQARVKNAENAFSRITGGTKWLSIEPLIEPLRFSRLKIFDWVVIGGASRSRETPEWKPPMDWLVDMHQQARRAKCRIYYKDNCGMDEKMRTMEFPWVEPKTIRAPDRFHYLGKSRNSDKQVEK